MPVVVGLGSNLGDRLANLQLALDLLSSHLRLEAVSRIYETAPMYVEDQPPFLNAAAKGLTSLAPFALLKVLKGVESKVGRRPMERYGPREIDLDLLAYGALSLRSESLQVPHPKTPERRFVLRPLADLAPAWPLPGLPPLDEMLRRTADQEQQVRPLTDAELSIHCG